MLNFLKKPTIVPELKKSDRRRMMEAGYDLDLISRTQSQGGITPYETYFEYGNGVASILTVYDFPASGMADYWLRGLMTHDYIIGWTSVGIENKEEIKKEIGKAIDEKGSQISNKNRAADNISASDDYQANIQTYRELNSTNAQIKRLYVRLLVYAPNREELKKRITNIYKSNDSFGITTFLGEQEEERRSLLMPTMKQENMLFHRKGVPVDLTTIGGMYYQDHIQHEDPNGSYLGYTSTSGAVNFDFWLRDKVRTRSFMFTSGQPGMGKSTLTKLLTYDSFTRGHYIRNFDISNEYTGLTKQVAGVFIDLAKSENKINPMEVFATDTDIKIDENGNPKVVVNQINSFNKHIQKLRTIFQSVNPHANADDILVLNDLIGDFYHQYHGMWSKNPERDLKKGKKIKITGLPHDEYPILSDFVTWLDQRKRLNGQNGINQSDQPSINRIARTFGSLLKNEGNIFEGWTNIRDFQKDAWVTFRTGSLKTHGQGVYNAQMNSVLSLLQSHVVANGQYWREMIALNKATDFDVAKYLINLDECQEIITPKFPEGTALIAEMMEQMRKNYCGIILAAPTIKGMIEENSKDEYYVSSVKKIFGLCQFRNFFNLPPEDIESLSSVLGNSVSKEELEKITKLERGQVFMNIMGVKSLTFKIAVSDPSMLKMFGGGEG